MNGAGTRLIITGDPLLLPAYATHPWLKPADGNQTAGEHVDIPTRVGWATVNLTIGKHDDGTREALITFIPVNPDLEPYRLPYGQGVERIEALDPENAQALAQYAHTLAAQGKARITNRIGPGACDGSDRKPQEEGLEP